MISYIRQIIKYDAGHLLFGNIIERGVSLHISSILYPQNPNLSRKSKIKYENTCLHIPY